MPLCAWSLYLPRWRLCDQCGLSVSHSSVCVQDYCKSNQPISLKLGSVIGPTSRKNWSTFGGNLVPYMDSGALFHFPSHCRKGDFRRFISMSHTALRQCEHLWRPKSHRKSFFTGGGGETNGHCCWRLLPQTNFIGGIVFHGETYHLWVWPWNVPKVIKDGAIGQNTYDFLLVYCEVCDSFGCISLLLFLC